MTPHGVLLKASKIIPCNALIPFFREALTNHRSHISLGGQHAMTLSDGLPQRSVLLRLFFSIYTSDQPLTLSQRFVCADNIEVTTQAMDLPMIEQILIKGLKIMEEYFLY